MKIFQLSYFCFLSQRIRKLNFYHCGSEENIFILIRLGLPKLVKKKKHFAIFCRFGQANILHISMKNENVLNSHMEKYENSFQQIQALVSLVLCF